MLRPISKFSRQRQRGMTLIEALIALLVLSIGLLGVAALQMTTLKYNHSAHIRSQASALAYDISDRMRANRAAALASAYDVAIGAMPAGVTVAAVDLIAWKGLLAATLPAGDGAIALGPDNVMVITVQWDDSRDDRLDPPVQFVTETQL